jgi:hypothetical protein
MISQMMMDVQAFQLLRLPRFLNGVGGTVTMDSSRLRGFFEVGYARQMVNLVKRCQEQVERRI